ncbi:MAG: glutathione S-transferase [Pikeienuella sp.]
MNLPTPIRLYETRRAPNPRRVNIFLSEKGVDIDRTEIDIMGGEHYAPGHHDRADSHHVPLLELSDGSYLTESVAICRYIEALHPSPNLMGEDAKEAAEIEMWQRRMEMGLLLNIAFVIRHGVPTMQKLEHVQVPAWSEACKPRVEKAMRDLDARLQKSSYVAGDRFTIADITPWVGIDFMRVIKQGPPDDCDALNDWLARMRSRPSAAA